MAYRLVVIILISKPEICRLDKIEVFEYIVEEILSSRDFRDFLYQFLLVEK